MANEKEICVKNLFTDDHDVGDIFDVSMRVKVIESPGCGRCVFFNKNAAVTSEMCKRPYSCGCCSDINRSDGKGVVFIFV